MRITIDRVENGFVVVELPSGEAVNVPVALFPEAAEGDFFVVDLNMNRLIVC
jgi:hypothetical protein